MTTSRRKMPKYNPINVLHIARGIAPTANMNFLRTVRETSP